ncbi:MAG TPA: lysyl oxidase family protein [Microlunatus sp.]|nr:lysyl oxidase family protein [Microlunatus sp.]
MNRSLGARVRRGTMAVVLGLALAGPGLVGGTPADAAAKSGLTLERSRSSVTVFRAADDEGAYLYGDLGVYAVAGKKAFEVEAKRSSYAKRIKATWVRKGKDKKLPAPADFTGLSKFSTTTYTNAAGKVVARSTSTFCPNTYLPVRRRPSAPATSPYPAGCDFNPYSLGAVWGIQAGYAVPLTGDPYSGTAFPDLPLGVYQATISVAPAYRKALGLSKRKSTVSVKVIVKADEQCDEEDPMGCLSAMRARRVAAQERSVSAASQPRKLSGKRAKPSGPLPDLRSLPAWGIGVDQGRYLTFSATVWNGGPGRLVVDGFRSTKDPDLMKAYQYFFTKSGKQKGYAKVGGMEWDPRDGHEHWHFQDFATYRLVDSKKKLVVRSAKEAFCLANTDAIDYSVKGANWQPDNTDLRTSCGDRASLGVREVLDAGSGDTYAQDLPGQSFDLQGLRNGTYYIQIKANPAKVLYEKRTSNNVSYRKVVIGGTAGDRTVKVAKVGIINEPSPMDMESHGTR